MLLIKNIRLLAGILPAGVTKLAGADMARLETISDAWLTVGDDGRIAAFGPADTMPAESGYARVYDAGGCIVTPTFVDSHTHLVFAASRQGEFVDRLRGLSYAEIAARGGGILCSADRLNAMTEDELFNSSLRRLQQVAACGTGAIEIKSGYALTLEGELKMLRVIRRLKQAMPGMTIVATFLGAHAVGRAYAGRQDDYVQHVIDNMLPAVAAEGLADYVDVFCEQGFFTVEQTERIAAAAHLHGLSVRLHANQLHPSGGVEIGVKVGAHSVDHLESAGDAQIELLARNTDTIPTALPGASFFLREPYAPARKLIDAGCALAMASDFNPGTSPTGDMRFIWSLGCISMRLLPAEALNAVTINSAAALRLADQYGSITPGKWASLIFYSPDVPDIHYIPYAFTHPSIDRVMLKGEFTTR